MTQRERSIEQSGLHVREMEIRARKAVLKSNYQYELGKIKVEEAVLDAECARSINAATREDDFGPEDDDETAGYD
jgi:hypothetical protein